MNDLDTLRVDGHSQRVWGGAGSEPGRDSGGGGGAREGGGGGGAGGAGARRGHAMRALRAIVRRELFKLFARQWRPGLGPRPAVAVAAAPPPASAPLRLADRPLRHLHPLPRIHSPGLIGMVLLFNGMQSSLSLVYDREIGMMRLLLTAPLPRWTSSSASSLPAPPSRWVQAYAFPVVAPPVGVYVPPIRLADLAARDDVAAFLLARSASPCRSISASSRSSPAR